MTTWPADKVERHPLETLILYAKNARTHSPEQVDQIAASMKEWGWTNPVLVDEIGEIIAGHGRVLAAGQLGFSDVPVMVADGWTDDQKRAYRIADNRLAELASWDFETLADEFNALGDDFNAEFAGFSWDEIEKLWAPENDPLAEWQGMPEFEQNSKMAFKTIAVHFPDAAAVEKFAKLIKQPLTEKTRFVWYPQQPNVVAIDKRYEAAE
jgi:hypothetical protein